MEASTKIGRWEAWGAVWIVAAGVPLHFLYSATGWEAVAWLGPVNESTWEHFKLAFWPGLAWAVLEWRTLPDLRATLWTAKLASFAAMPILIAAIFYGYKAILGTHLLALDIGTFVISVAVGQWIGFRVWSEAKRWRLAPWLVGILAVAFVAFSFRSPPVFLFEDPAGRRSMDPPSRERGAPGQTAAGPALRSPPENNGTTRTQGHS